MTLYHVMWQHWQDSGDAIQLIKEDLSKGTFKDWGVFASTGRGYAIVNARDDAELLKVALKYRAFGVQCLSIEPVLSIDQVLKIRSEIESGPTPVRR
ncbi:MAG: DUF3303 family protein [Thermoplasmata archaeon]